MIPTKFVQVSGVFSDFQDIFQDGFQTENKELFLFSDFLQRKNNFIQYIWDFFTKIQNLAEFKGVFFTTPTYQFLQFFHLSLLGPVCW